MVKERILVTGGAGYIGSVLVPKLLEEGYSVKILDSMIHENSYPLLLSYTNSQPLLRHPLFEGLIKKDIRDESSVRELVRQADIIMHLAAIVGAPACKKYPHLSKTVNINGTRNLLKYLSKDQKFLFASTGSNYGRIEGICMEDTALKPVSLYGKTKTKAEKEVLEKEGVAYRFATAFGLSPRFRMDLLVNDFTFKLMNRTTLEIYEADAKRTFIHVSDIALSFLFGIKNYSLMIGEAFNVGDESMNITKKDLAKKIKEKIEEKTKIKSTIWFDNTGKFKDLDQRDYEVSYEKIKKIGKGFHTKISLDQGLEELINFYSVFKLKNPFGNA